MKPTTEQLLDDYLADPSTPKACCLYAQQIGRARVMRWIEQLIANKYKDASTRSAVATLATDLEAYLVRRGLCRTANVSNNALRGACVPSWEAMQAIARERTRPDEEQLYIAMMAIMAGLDEQRFRQLFPRYDYRRICADVENLPVIARNDLREAVEEARAIEGPNERPQLTKERAIDLYKRHRNGETIAEICKRERLYAKTLTDRWSRLKLPYGRKLKQLAKEA
jgi:hypothetical protein